MFRQPNRFASSVVNAHVASVFLYSFLLVRILSKNFARKSVIYVQAFIRYIFRTANETRGQVETYAEAFKVHTQIEDYPVSSPFIMFRWRKVFVQREWRTGEKRSLRTFRIAFYWSAPGLLATIFVERYFGCCIHQLIDIVK